MTDLIYDYITTGIDLMIAGAILASVIILLRSTTVLTTISATQQANSDRVNYYREFNQFDNRDVNQADVIGALLYYGKDMNVYVLNCKNGYRIYSDTSDGKIWLCDSSWNKIQTLNTTTEIQQYILVDYTFKAQLYENGQARGTTPQTQYQGGVISGLYFKRN